MHSVKVTARMTGLSPDTLRAWERRYGAVKPKRDVKGRRTYDASDLARLRLLSQAVALGYPVYRAAALSASELELILTQAGNRILSEHYAPLIQRALTAVENYRPDACDEVLGLAMVTLSPVDAVRHVLSPLLSEVGERWSRGKLSAAQEHLLTASMERLLMATIHTYQKAAYGPRAVYSTLSGERHGIGCLLAAFIAASQGIRCCYLGPDLPPIELARAVKKCGAVALGLSLISLTGVQDAPAQLNQLGKLLPKGVALWLGGAGIGELAAADLSSRCTLIRNFEDYAQQLEVLKIAH